MMGTKPTGPITIFYCYAHKDRNLHDELEKHMAPLKRLGQITEWSNREIQPGMDWEQEINTHLNTANIILLLVSSNFMHSDYCYSVEMQRAFERHNAGEAHVIPVILRPVYWKETVLGKLQALPKNGKPITRWENRDEAFLDVVNGVHDVLGVLLFQKMEALVEKADSLYATGEYHEAATTYEHALSVDPKNIATDRRTTGSLLSHGTVKALAAYEAALRLDPSNPLLYMGKGHMLSGLARQEEALDAYSEAVRLAPHYIEAYSCKAKLLSATNRYEEAVVACNRIIELAPDHIEAYSGKGSTLLDLHRYEEAVMAYDEIIRLTTEHSWVYMHKAEALRNLHRYEEEVMAYDEVIRLTTEHSWVYMHKAEALIKLGRYESALKVYDEIIQRDPSSIHFYQAIGNHLASLGYYSTASSKPDPESESSSTCPNCKAPNPGGMFCEHCGYPLNLDWRP